MRDDRAAVREAGYNMVILVVAVTILNIMLALALPAWSHLIRRDKEEELRSRGLQYAEAIRVFQMRYGRLPVRLEELVEVRPRSIRRLWTDPMVPDGKWGILFQGVPPGAEGEQEDPGNPGLRRVTIGPIVGVYSRSKEASLSTFFGAASYEQWRFTVDLLQRGTTFRTDHIPRLDLRNLGRPFGYGLEIARPVGEVTATGQDLAGGGPPSVPGQPGARPPGGRQRPTIPGRPGVPSGGQPGQPGGGGSFPGFPGDEPPDDTPPGGTPGFDPTLPTNSSSSAFLPPQ